MRILTVLTLFFLVALIAAKKQHNVDSVEKETLEHSAQKYTKEHQKSHHHNHKHKKHEEAANEAEPVEAKVAPVEVPEPEAELQQNLKTSKKAVAEERHKEQTKDLHLQDLTYEENLKKGHHGAHRAEVVEKSNKKAEKKLFADQESKHPVDEKVIEDSFEPLHPEPVDAGKSKKSKDKKYKDEKKSKDKSKNKKKAYEKSKDKYSKKSKDGKKNKDKKYKNKEKKY